MEISVPSIAYRYVPSGEFLVVGSGKSIQRCIFYVPEYTDYESSKLKEFKKYINTHIQHNKIPEFYKNPEHLRLLIKCKFNIEKAFANLLADIEWRSSSIPNSYFSLISKVETLLDTGVIYIHGRDNRFRPLLIIDCEKLRQMHLAIDSICRLLAFLLEFTTKKLMLPGKIENFILITDTKNIVFSSFPSHELKSLYNVFQEHFSYRLAVNYMVNASSSVALAKFFFSFIDKSTASKTKVLKNNGFDYLQQHFVMGQLEEKFGGKACNAERFWPPNMPSGVSEL